MHGGERQDMGENDLNLFLDIKSLLGWPAMPLKRDIGHFGPWYITSFRGQVTEVVSVMGRLRCYFHILWWHISAAIYEIAIVIILENFHGNSKFFGKFI